MGRSTSRRIPLRTALAAVAHLAVTSVLVAGVPPTLGTYPATALWEGENATVTPSAAPVGALRFTARAVPVGPAAEFSGKVEVDPTTGVVAVSNARPAGAWTLQLTATAPDTSTAVATLDLFVIAEMGCAPYGSANLTGSGTFSTGAGTTPQFGHVADFNEDGNQDFAVGVFTGDKVSVFLGDGLGGFGPELPLTTPAATNPQFPAVGDFNGDGHADIAASVVNGDSIAIWLGNGNGTFGARDDDPTVDVPRNMVVGDFNNDGKKDLAVAAGGVNNAVGVHLGVGDGTFLPFSPQATGGTSFALGVGNFTNDANEDLVTAVGTSVVLLTGNGSGGFAPTNVGTVANLTEWIEVADFNLDGHLDFSIDNIAAANNMNVFLGSGTGTFANAPGSPFTVVGTGTFGHGSGDFDGDGVIDLAISNLGGDIVTLFHGSGNGSFLSAGTVGVNGPRGVQFADLDQDGRQDLVIVLRDGAAIATRLGDCAVDITTSSLPDGLRYTPYPPTSIAASGGTPPYVFGATGLPGGLGIDAAGEITGEPLEYGLYLPRFSATDSTTIADEESPEFGVIISTYRRIPLFVDSLPFLNGFETGNFSEWDQVQTPP